MTTNSIELPDDLKSRVDETAQHQGYANSSEYIVALLTAASEKRGQIEEALVVGLNSGPAEPWTAEEWQAIRNRVV